MKGVPAIYKGRLVSKENFRTNVYSMNGSKKLVNTWDEYEQAMESGLWFATKKDALSRVPVAKLRVKRIKKEEAPVEVEDDFLPNASE